VSGSTTTAAAVLAREGAALEERQWVRLTRRCNNRCLFCHDSDRQDGSNVPLAQVLTEIRTGRERGAERLVLSGGEATLHPGFLEAVAAGRAAGYRWVQVISNGRMFSYERFTRQAAAAGLDEATVSVHGHTAELHDELAGAAGAFAQAIRGIQNLQRAGRVVSVDVVVCRPNVGVLQDILRFFMSMGIMEFDLLHLVPFGRAFDAERDRLFYDPATEAPRLLEALRMAELPGVHLWTNRWPAPLLEGVEHLIQDPHKLLDEVRGTAEGFQALLEAGTPLACAGERCGSCAMDRFCGAITEARERLASGRFETVAIAAAAVAGLPAGVRRSLARQREAAWRITAGDGSEVAAALAHLPAAETAPLELDLRRWSGLPGALGARVRRAVVRDEAALAAALRLPGCDLELPLERATALVAARALALAPDRVLFTTSPRPRLSSTLAEGLPPDEVAALASGARAEGVPLCLAPRSGPSRAVLAADTLRSDGVLDLFAWAERYVGEGARTRSLRCAGCAETDRCDGAHVNEVRAHGFSFMRPIGVA
jgi:pyruvate-formate lyase-activating enzyme